MKKKLFLILFLIITLVMSGCSKTDESNPKDTVQLIISSEEESSDENSASVDTSEMFSNRDFEIGYDESESAYIQLNGNTAVCSSNAVQISENTITIIDEGTYILSGTLDDGMIIVNAEKTDKTQLVLNGATIHSKTSAPIYILQADKVFITTATDTTNALSNGGTFIAIDENNIDSVIYSKEDVTLNGSGTLVVTSPAGHGIVSKDSLTITSGVYDINCASHALAGKDDVCIANGDFTIVSGKDGIHAENADDAASGFVYIKNGTYNIAAEGDGISSASYMQIEDGIFDITSGGGSVNATSETSESWGNFMGGGRHQGGKMDNKMGDPMGNTKGAPSGGPMGENINNTEDTATDSASIKGIKATTTLTIKTSYGKSSGNLSKKFVLKKNMLPTTGKIRFIPSKDWTASQPLKKVNGGFVDRFDNVWTKGPSRTAGEPFEWDVQLSKTGREKLGWLSRDNSHLNVSLKGEITHK